MPREDGFPSHGAHSNGDGHHRDPDRRLQDDSEDVGEWYGVRCLFHLNPGGVGVDGDGPDDEPGALYEERVTLWRAQSFDHAIALAEDEAEEYAEVLGADYLGLAQAYLLADELAPGAEVFSLIRRSTLDPDDYITRFFATGDERQEE